MSVTEPSAVCPQCHSAESVHSVQELAALASSQLGQQPGSPSAGWAAQPQQGPVPGWADEPRSGPLRGPGTTPAATGRGGLAGRGGVRNLPFRGSDSRYGQSPLDALGEDIAGAALSAAAGFVGRAISRRLERTVSERVLPAVAAGQEKMLRTQIEIAQRHPDLCACLTDQVIFLAGGSRVLPMPNLMTVTVPQADDLVAKLRES